MSKTEPIYSYIESGFELIFYPLIHIIEDVVFNNGDLSFLLNNLGITFKNDGNFNQLSDKAPKLLKSVLNEVLNIKHNLMLLEESDSEFYRGNLNMNFDIVTDLKAGNFKNIRTELSHFLNKQREKIDKIIENRFVF